MSSASHSLDPVAAVKDDVDRSRRLIAETLDDLSQHHSWLETYHREERRRAERLRRQEAFERLALRRRKAFWAVRRFAAALYAAAQTAARIAVSNGQALLRWTAPRARRLTVRTYAALNRSASRAWSGAGTMAENSLAMTRAGFLWSVRTSDVAGVRFRRRLAAIAAIILRRSAEATAPARKRTLILWLRTRHTLTSWVRTARADLPARARDALPAIDASAWSKAAVRRARLMQIASRRQARRLQARLARMTATAKPLWRRTRRHARVVLVKTSRRAAALEGRLSETVIRTGPRLHRILQLYAPSRRDASKRDTPKRDTPKRDTPETGRALIVRPGTALVCIAKTHALLPAIRTA